MGSSGPGDQRPGLEWQSNMKEAFESPEYGQSPGQGPGKESIQPPTASSCGGNLQAMRSRPEELAAEDDPDKRWLVGGVCGNCRAGPCRSQELIGCRVFVE